MASSFFSAIWATFIIKEGSSLSALMEVAFNNIKANSMVMIDELLAYKGIFQFNNVKHVKLITQKKKMQKSQKSIKLKAMYQQMELKIFGASLVRR